MSKLFTPEKAPASGSRGMVVSNHPLASAAGMQMLASGGNAVDAAVATLFALSVVEPMMVGLLGGGFAHLRLPDGRQTILEGQSACPLAVGPTTFTPDPDASPGMLDAVGRLNSVGRTAVATPGNLMAWTQMLSRHGSMSLAEVTEPAIRYAMRGFAATPYLHECVRECAADLARDPEISRVFMPDGKPVAAGARVINEAYADTLSLVVRDGADALYKGLLGDILCNDMQRHAAHISKADLLAYRTRDLDVLRGTYRGFEITGPPPPCSGPLHIIQMLKILEGIDVDALGFGTTDGIHLLAELLKSAFADRAAATADPDFVPVPISRLTSADYAAQRRALINMLSAQSWQAGVSPADATNEESAASRARSQASTRMPGPGNNEGQHTTHITVADRDGRIVSATQTINSLFGARYMVPGTGMIPNNYLYVFNPRPGLANSLAPGKRVTSSMAPLIVLKGGKPAFALGLPGGLRIFPSAMQAVINLIDHKMDLQQAVEAPRIWTQGFGLELEPAVPDSVAKELTERGHNIERVPNVGGGMNAIRFHEDGRLEGAACWRADGTAMGIGGGLARDGVRFLPEGLKSTTPAR